MDSFKKFGESRLPEIDCFFSSLKTVKLLMKNIKELVMFGKCLK